MKEDLNITPLSESELGNIKGGWLEIVGAALGVVIAAGEIAYEFGHSLGESYRAKKQ